MKLTRYDVIVIGAGINGLIAATSLAKAGFKTLVLERTDRPGGCVRTSELAPGFRCPTLAHTVSIDADIIRTLDLERHGLQIIRPEVDVCALTPDGRALVLWREAARAAREIRAQSPRDAGQYPKFLEAFARVSTVLRVVCAAPPPSIDHPGPGDVLALLKATRAFRKLPRPDAYRLLRWIPMPILDFTAEWFEGEPLRATIAAGGTLGSFLGPRSPGSTAVLLFLGSTEGRPIPGWQARGACADALVSAAKQAGVEVRLAADVARIRIAGASVTGVILANGDDLSARAVVSSLDPRRTFLELVGPTELEPEFVRRVLNIRMNGTLAKVNYAVSGLPRVAALASREAGERTAALSGRIRLATDSDTLERAFDAAKFGRMSESPSIELAIPSVSDSSLAPQGSHVVSAYAHYAPSRLRAGTWGDERERLATRVTETIEQHLPGFTSSIVAREVITPGDLETTFGLTGGHIFHGELALDQLFIARPLLGWARYRTPIERLYLCGAGTHPGTGSSGRSGALAASEIARNLSR